MDLYHAMGISEGEQFRSDFKSQGNVQKYLKVYVRQPRKSMTHVGNTFTYNNNVQDLTLTKINY